jgi:branched-chain amino acid aminotransferase
VFKFKILVYPRPTSPGLELKLINLNNPINTNDNRGEFFIINGIGKPGVKFDSRIFHAGVSFYEVIRIKEKIPLFLDDHLKRLACSLRVGNSPGCPPLKLIKEHIRLLIYMNSQITEGNIRLTLHFPFRLQDNPDIYTYHIPFYYPSAEERASGISLTPLNAERQNIHSKMINMDFRTAVNQKLQNDNAYEALLIDKEGYITEGSKSNFFMIRGRTIFTAPEKDVLPGITRKYVLEICRSFALDIKEVKINFSEAGNYESCFITGTSPGVLAVRNIGPISYNHDHQLLTLISREYEKLVGDYIKTHKNNNRDNNFN